MAASASVDGNSTTFYQNPQMACASTIMAIAP
jgi:hypothetical protein